MPKKGILLKIGFGEDGLDKMVNHLVLVKFLQMSFDFEF